MRKIFLAFFVGILLLFFGSCNIHFGDGDVEIWVDHTPSTLGVQSAVIYLKSVELGFVGHGTEKITMDPVEINLAAPQGAVPGGTSQMNAGSYNKVILTFSGGTVLYNDVEYDIQVENSTVEIEKDFEVTRDGKIRIFITVEGSSLIIDSGPGFKLNPVVYISVEQTF